MSGGSWIRINAVEAHLDAATVNTIIEAALGKRATSITQKPALRQAIGQEFVRAVTPFVPMLTGELRQSGRATTDGRVYWSAIGKHGENYAAEMYDEYSVRWPNGYYRPTTPNTTPRWVEKVRPGTPEYDAFVNNIIPIIVEGFREDG